MRKKYLEPLDKDEQAIEDNFDTGKAFSQDIVKEKIMQAKKAATNYLKKDKRISIRVYGTDLERLKEIAEEEGLPYQTLITSILHKFSNGRFKEISK